MGVVVLAFGSEPTLDECLSAIRRSEDVRLELVVVDNGCNRADFGAVVSRHDARVVRPSENVGFAAGCNLGVASLTDADTIALVNSDAVLEPTALHNLDAALDADVGVATASVRLADAPHLVNSAGNPVHFTGISWAGGLGDPAAAHATRRDVASASGAAMAIRRHLWQELGGFDGEYFTYVEDTELSLRCWLSGWRVVYVPAAIALHHYDFSRHQRKHYYLERNRLLLLLTLYERRTLLLIAPALLLWEVAVAAGAVIQGWGPSKLRGWLWLLRHAGHVRRRRRLIQSTRRHGDAALVGLLEERISAPNVPVPRGFGTLNDLMALNWRLVRRLLERRRTAIAGVRGAG